MARARAWGTRCRRAWRRGWAVGGGAAPPGRRWALRAAWEASRGEPSQVPLGGAVRAWAAGEGLKALARASLRALDLLQASCQASQAEAQAAGEVTSLALRMARLAASSGGASGLSCTLARSNLELPMPEMRPWPLTARRSASCTSAPHLARAARVTSSGRPHTSSRAPLAAPAAPMASPPSDRAV